MDPEFYITLPIPKEWAALIQSTPLLLLLAGVFAIVLYLAISEHWEWLQNRPSPMPWFSKNYVAILLTFGFTVIILAVVYWIWDIRGEIGEIVSLLSTELSTQNPSAENIRNLAYAIGALLAAVALSATIPFQLIKVWVNERLAKTTEQGHMTDRITKAVEQLGAEKTVKVHRRSEEGNKLYEDGPKGEPDFKKPIITETTEPNLEVRLGAIYALERIAQDSQRDHAPVMKILCAYVRLNAPKSDGFIPKPFKSTKPTSTISTGLPFPYLDGEYKRKKEHDENVRQEIDKLSGPRIDVQSALDAIGHRKYANPEQNGYIASLLDLSNCNLQKAKLTGHFAGADFSGSLIDGATLNGDFRGCSSLRASIVGLTGEFKSTYTFKNKQNPPPNN